MQFGRGPVTPGIWEQQRSPWLLATHPLRPGMINTKQCITIFKRHLNKVYMDTAYFRIPPFEVPATFG